MVAYEFYTSRVSKEPNLIGILPERRKHSTRITQESIMNWGRTVVGDGTGFNQICFTRVIIDEGTGRIIENVE